MQVNDTVIPWLTHGSPFQRASRPRVLNSQSVLVSRNHLNRPWCGHGICPNASKWPTRYHAIACSCAQTLIYWSVFPSTIVRLFACYTERNVNQCILNGRVLRQLTCSTKRYERERKREREGQRERERARERLQKGCAQIVQCTLVMFMPKPIYIIRLWKLQ